MSSEIKKYSLILLKGTFAVSLANAGTKMIGFILLPVFTYYLSPKDYGIVAMFTLVLTVLSLIYNPGLMSATMRLYHAISNEEERKELIGSANRFFFFVPIITIIIGLLFGPKIFSLIFKEFEFYPYGFLALILSLFIQPTRIWTTLMTLQYKIHITALYSFLSVLIGIIITLILVVIFKLGAMGKVLGMFPGAIFLFIIGLIIVNKYTNGKYSFKSLKKQLVLGFPLIGALWAYQALDLIGKFLLERMSDIHSLGIYAFAFSIAQLPMFLVAGVKELWNPVFYENMNRKDYKTISQLITYFIAGLTIINLIVILFSKEIFILFINDRYYEAIPLISFLVLGIYFNGLLTISNSLLGYQNKFGLISVFALIASLINLILNVILIPNLGVLGAVLAITIAYIIFFLLGICNQRKTLSLIQSKGIMLIPIISMILATLITYFMSTIYVINDIFINEIILKIIFLCSVILLFLKTKIITKKELDYIFRKIKLQLKK